MDAYVIDVKPLDGMAEVRVGNMVLARSNAARIMEETALGSFAYFPKEDCRLDLLLPSKTRTFCPFKGTARYWSAALPSGAVEDIGWSYDRPLDEAVDVGAHIAFDPAKVSVEFDTTGLKRPSVWGGEEDDFTTWLLAQAFAAPEPKDLVAGLMARLNRDGFSLARLNLCVWTLHPEILGQVFTNWRDEPGVSVSDVPISLLSREMYQNSPISYVTRGLGGVRQRLDDREPEFTFAIMDELREKGCTDYVAMPLIFSDGSNHVLTLASDAPDGFSTDQLGTLFMHSGVISRILETHAQRRTTKSLLTTYLGPRSANRVLAGASHRGDGETVSAAILYCDLRNSTIYSDQFRRDDLLGILNDFFECVVGGVEGEGGEVLKFIGDAVLAIFPSDGEEEGEESARLACQKALRAADEILANVPKLQTPQGDNLDCVVALNFGAAKYGNVGSPGRLDYTVTGPAVHEVVRMQEMCKSLSLRRLISQQFADQNGEAGLRSLGAQSLRGLSEEMEVFT